MNSSSSPNKPVAGAAGSLATPSKAAQPGAEFYRLAEVGAGSSKALSALGLGGGGVKAGREGGARKHRRGSRDSREQGGLLPLAHKAHLASLFQEIETEFEKLYVENVRLKDQINRMEEKDSKLEVEDTDGFDINVMKKVEKFTNKNFPKTKHKLKAQTSKIVSSFKTSGALGCSLVTEYRGHRDGIWDCCVAGPVLATASADRTVRLWAVETGRCLGRYTAHQGSVNSVQFHPGGELALSASGDCAAHIWSYRELCQRSRTDSQETEADSSDDGLEGAAGATDCPPAQTHTLSILGGHQGVVASAAWLAGGDQAVTASWDRTAGLWDVASQSMIQSLVGHDQELTHCASHAAQRLVVTASKDSTFRLWDFRENIHSVSVFQGHTEAVTCAAFSRTEHIVSGSDDRTVKVWDLRNMRAPLTNIQTDSPVNKVSISGSGLVAVPQDNRHCSVYDVSGSRVARLPREQGKCHMRMVTSVAWAAGELPEHRPNLFTVGFDRVALGWRLRSKEELKIN